MKTVPAPLRSVGIGSLAATFLAGWLGGGAPVARAVVHSTVSFPSPQNLATSFSNPIGIAVGDLDGDGFPDVVATGNFPERIVWFRNAGDGTFVPGQFTVTTSPATAALTNVALADLNVDGRLDVIFWAGQSVRWTPNLGGSNPAGQFGYNASNETANQIVVSGTGAPETIVAAGDLNNDGRPDVLSATSRDAVSDNSIAWVPNLTTGFAPRVVVSTAGQSPTSVEAVDLDNDGWRDLLVSSSADSTLAWFRNLGSGNFGTAPGHRRIITTSMTAAQSVTAGDLNGDGFRDVVACGVGSSVVRWYAHNGSATSPVIGPTGNIVTEGVSGATQVIVHDVDLDGWLDVVICVGNGSRVVWCENLGGNFGNTTANQRVIGTPSGPFAIGVGDMDGNGTPDVASNAVFGSAVTFFRNEGGQTALASTNTAPASIIEGRRDDVLRVAVTHRGLVTDSALRLGSLSLLLESGAGVPLSTAQANALIDKISVHVDADGSGTFDPAVDPAVSTVTELVLNAGGVLTFPFAGSLPASIEVAPTATRSFFVVVKMSATASTVSPPTVRVTHRSSGANRTVLRDATTAGVLTSEPAGSANVTSSSVTATPQSYTYTDWSFISYDTAGTPGTGPLDIPASDGIPNLLKFGLALDPLSASAPLQLPAMSRAGAARIFTHRRPTQSAGIAYQYDVAREMGNWEPALPGVHYTLQETALAGGVTRRDLTLLGTWGRSFMRVRVVLTP